MALDTLVMRGASRADCLQKITERYGIHFTPGREKTIYSGGFFGIGRREEVELEFYISPQRALSPSGGVSAPPVQAPILSRDRQVVGLSMPSPAALPGDGTTLDFEEAKKRVLAAARKDPEKAIREAREHNDKESEQRIILEKLNEIEKKLGAGIAQQQHPALARIEEILRANDFSDHYSKRLLERARRELPLEILENFDLAQDRVLEWIGESIGIYKAPERPPRRPGDRHSARVMVLVGPTGVGKTTTIAKLAAIYGFDDVSRPRPLLSVRMISTDAFRIGAQHQIEIYGKTMEIPISIIDNHLDLQKEIDAHREVADLILVDTTGRSPADSEGLGRMKQLLDACGPKAEVHLALAAGTKTADLTHAMQQFEPFNYRAVLLTKLDETRHVGNIISALAEKDKLVSYVTHGQVVPKHIRKANVIQFLINLKEFRIDREAFEKRFPATEANQFQWS